MFENFEELLPSKQRPSKAQRLADYKIKKSAEAKESMYEYYYFTNDYDGMDSMEELFEVSDYF